MKSIFLVLAIVILSAVPALAHDSAHLVCMGYMTATPGPNNYGISVQFDEMRASDGASRVETLSSVWAGDLYQGSRLNKTDGFGQNGTVVMTLKGNPKAAFYKGSYNLVLLDAETQKYDLQLKGQLNTVPSQPSMAEAVSTTLNCVNLSN
jgi:hypothetical protein